MAEQLHAWLQDKLGWVSETKVRVGDDFHLAIEIEYEDPHDP